MIHELPQLPFPKDGLAPLISPETLDYHYGKHHQAYVNNLNKLISGTEFEAQSLEDIIRKSSGNIFNNSAQVFNHTFYWNCLTPGGGGEPSGELAQAIADTFGDFDTFKSVFTDSAVTLFGSGWVWLIQKADGSLDILAGSNACCAVAEGYTALLTCDVWEHAYYIDYRNARPKYVEAFWKLVNWNFVAGNLA
ncbi:MAG: superoxide dismutase [Fe] [Candidatus Zixiibacteriota bacterium]|nr:MAG: superoxide dismutase [Fe] [candidate division Zixibacteria bacterium]